MRWGGRYMENGPRRVLEIGRIGRPSPSMRRISIYVGPTAFSAVQPQAAGGSIWPLFGLGALADTVGQPRDLETEAASGSLVSGGLSRPYQRSIEPTCGVEVVSCSDHPDCGSGCAAVLAA
jgi:hypothetical protein